MKNTMELKNTVQMKLKFKRRNIIKSHTRMKTYSISFVRKEKNIDQSLIFSFSLVQKVRTPSVLFCFFSKKTAINSLCFILGNQKTTLATHLPNNCQKPTQLAPILATMGFSSETEANKESEAF